MVLVTESFVFSGTEGTRLLASGRGVTRIYVPSVFWLSASECQRVPAGGQVIAEPRHGLGGQFVEPHHEVPGSDALYRPDGFSGLLRDEWLKYWRGWFIGACQYHQIPGVVAG